MPPPAPAPSAEPLPPPPDRADLLVVGAGAAGLFAAAWAGRTAATGRPLTIVAVDGARKLGAKILVAGGGRCNVTHVAVSETDYAGSTPPAIRKVLRRFGVADTVRFFADAAVPLKEEDTGKLFPTTDDARTLNVDLAPTILAAARVAAPAGMQGRDIAPRLAAAMDAAIAFMEEHDLRAEAESFCDEAVLRLTDKLSVIQMFFDRFHEVSRTRAAVEYLNSRTGCQICPVPV